MFDPKFIQAMLELLLEFATMICDQMSWCSVMCYSLANLPKKLLGTRPFPVDTKTQQPSCRTVKDGCNGVVEPQYLQAQLLEDSEKSRELSE